jgi:hypothetical protein
MTIIKLKNALEKLIAEGHGRKMVCVDKSKVTHPLESDGVCIIPATDAEIQTHEIHDEDGGLKVLSNGCTATRTALVITAEC